MIRDIHAQQAQLLAEVRRLSLAVHHGGSGGAGTSGPSREQRFFTFLADRIVAEIHDPGNRLAVQPRPAAEVAVSIPPSLTRVHFDDDRGVPVAVLVKGTFDDGTWLQRMSNGWYRVHGRSSDVNRLVNEVGETLHSMLRDVERRGLDSFRRRPPVTGETATAVEVTEEADGEVRVSVAVKLAAPRLAEEGANETGPGVEGEAAGEEEGRGPAEPKEEGRGGRKASGLHPPPQESTVECCVCFEEVAQEALVGLGACGHALCAACTKRITRPAADGGGNGGDGAVTCPLCRVRSTTFLQAQQQWVWAPAA